ncbi:MAG: amidohydrolase [Firmicutes bacterium]|nr:amidohydrolase [Bacillota bacterium]
MTRQELYDIARSIEQQYGSLYEEVCQQVYDFAELGMKEFKSSAYLCEKLEEIGFRVTRPVAGVETAFMAEYGEGHPRVCFLAEYDALPGYGPNQDQNGHACGHNWIAANTFGAAHVLKMMHDRGLFTGSIVYAGSPAEETVGGKINMVDAGCYDDCDLAMQIHIGGGTETRLGSQYLAMDSLRFTFHGVSSHAAGAPERGVNALDAAYLMFNGVNALRQHVTSDARIHGIISNGGLAPNVVPALAESLWYVRAADRNYVNELVEKVINCAKGACLMTGSTMEYQFVENSFDNLKINPFLIDEMAACMKEAGISEVSTEIEAPSGSSDVGNVSWACPTLGCNMGIGNTDGARCHEEAFLPNCTGPVGFAGLHKAVLAQVFLSLNAYTDEALQKKLYERKAQLQSERTGESRVKVK